MPFKLISNFKPCGDQPEAIRKLSEGILSNKKYQTLLGVTGSGKTYTMAHVIARVNKPSLIMAPNKTLAAQLYSELKVLFPHNAVEYFVSYYDYYQPEAYVPRTDTYIEKDSAINEDIDKMRHSATRSLLERSDVIIVASVSCIYGLGSPEAYHGMLVDLKKGMNVQRGEIIKKLVSIQYSRNDIDFHRGTFRVRGDIIEIFPPYEDDKAIRMEFFGDEIDNLSVMDPLKGNTLSRIERVAIYPGSHYVTPKEQLARAIDNIREELKERINTFHNHGRLVEEQRIQQRTQYDLEMIEEIGFCKGIENYSRHLTGRPAGVAPPTLLEYFPKDFLLFIDESHIAIPQIGGMYEGDRSRKGTLVEYGFRLPSALDNRPLKFSEFEAMTQKVVFVSATPGPYEMEQCQNNIAEQIVRPTGLVDPPVFVRPVENQVDDLLLEIKKTAEAGERVLVTTLTKRMAENLSSYFQEKSVRVKYLHSDIETLERFEILRDLRLGKFDVLVGINLLREGLDLPEVSLVAILDADKEGFLRSERSLIQTFGRAARNLNGRVICYADKQTGSLKRALHETDRRRQLQSAYNAKYGITPQSINKEIRDSLIMAVEADYVTVPITGISNHPDIPAEEIGPLVESLTRQMKKHSEKMEYEEAARLRDEIQKLKQFEMTYGIKD